LNDKETAKYQIRKFSTGHSRKTDFESQETMQNTCATVSLCHKI